jgi:hypothetical protein
MQLPAVWIFAVGEFGSFLELSVWFATLNHQHPPCSLLVLYRLSTLKRVKDYPEVYLA